MAARLSDEVIPPRPHVVRSRTMPQKTAKDVALRLPWPNILHLFFRGITFQLTGAPGYELLIWNGIVVRAGAPQPIVERLHHDLVRAANQADIVSTLAADGSRPVVMAPEAFGIYIRDEIVMWSRVIKAAGIRAE